jgi:hypothetical protein
MGYYSEMTFIHKHDIVWPKTIAIAETPINGKRHYTIEDDYDGTLVLPSVTTVLGSQPKPELDAWRKRIGEEKADVITNASAQRGSILHNMIEQYLNNKVITVNNTESAYQMFIDLKPYLNNINMIYCQEKVLYSKKFGIAGRVDTIGEYEGKLSVIDFKNARRTRTEKMVQNYFLQTTAYAGLFESMTGIAINQIVILMAVEDKEPQIFIRDPRDYVRDLVKVIKDYTAKPIWEEYANLKNMHKA